MAKIRALSSKLGEFFPILVKGTGKPPPIPPSYAPEEMLDLD